MSLAEELTRITAALRKMDPEVSFDGPEERIGRDEIAKQLEEACGFAPAELVEWYLWVENQYSSQKYSFQTRLPFLAWGATPIEEAPLTVFRTYGFPEDCYIEILTNQLGGSGIFAHVFPNEDKVAIGIGAADAAPRVLTDDLESYVAMWRELLEDHAQWSEEGPYWNIRGVEDPAVDLMNRVGI